MPFPILSLLILGSQDRVREGIPHFSYKPAITVGQREIVLGPLLLSDTVMEVRFDNDVPAVIGEGKVAPPAWKEYAKGYVRWSVSDGMLFNKPCRILKTDGTTRGENSTKLHKMQYGVENTTTYWIRPDGKLLRQAVELADPNSRRHAEAVFWDDHIEVSIADGPKSRSFTIYPNVDLKLVDAQFKPMIDDGKIVQQYKEYCSFDPFTQAFTKWKATVNGTFHGTWLGTKFEGPHIDIEGPKDTDNETVFISKENDLIKVDLAEHTAIVLSFLPKDRDPFSKAINSKIGGGKG